MGCVFLYFSPAEGTPENLVNVSLSWQQSIEPSLNDFQDFVVDMQKTITGLRKQVRTVVYYIRLDLLDLFFKLITR